MIEQRFPKAKSGFLPRHGSPHEATRPARLCFPRKAGLLPTKGASTMRNTVIGLAAAAAIITAGPNFKTHALCTCYAGYSCPQGEDSRGVYRLGIYAPRYTPRD